MRMVRQQELGEVRKEVASLVADNTRLSSDWREIQLAQAHAHDQCLAWKRLWHGAMAHNLRLSARLSFYEAEEVSKRAPHHAAAC